MKRHDTDVMSLVFGLLFLGVFTVWALAEYSVIGFPGLQIAVPTLLVTVGVVGLMASIAKIRGGRGD